MIFFAGRGRNYCGQPWANKTKGKPNPETQTSKRTKSQWVECDVYCQKLEPERPTCCCVCGVHVCSIRSRCGHQVSPLARWFRCEPSYTLLSGASPA